MAQNEKLMDSFRAINWVNNSFLYEPIDLKYLKNSALSSDNPDY